MYTIDNSSFAQLWLNDLGQQPIHDRHQGSQGFANWVGLYSGILSNIVLPELKSESLVINDGLPGSNSPKIPESVRLLRHRQRLTQPTTIYGIDGDPTVGSKLVELLAPFAGMFRFSAIDAILTVEGVQSSQDFVAADATMINHGIDDAALFELSQGRIGVYDPGQYTSHHAREIVTLIGRSSKDRVIAAQTQAALSLLNSSIQLTDFAGVIAFTHYNTVNWTRYHETPEYYAVISNFAQGAFDILQEQALKHHGLEKLETQVDPYVLFDSQNGIDANVFDTNNLQIYRKTNRAN